MKSIPAIQKYMTYLPKSIEVSQTIAEANDFMKSNSLRHLPVLRNGKLIGLISDRDINFVLQFQDVDPRVLTVEDAYTPDPYITLPTAPLNEVVEHMAQKKQGCAIVVDHEKIVGIFTEIDAYKALGDLLETRLRHV